jgi:pimeloyl-ACP methyl ester carboxylesterase
MREDGVRHSEGRTIATRLGNVTMEVRGPADGPIVLLIHGTAGWSGFWRNVARHLATRGWQAVAVDMPPFGYSEHDPRARYSRAAQAERLGEVIGRLSSRPVIVVGHSFGSGAAVELALRHPWMVSRLVLVDAALGEIDPPDDGSGLAQRALGQSWVAQPLVSATMTNPLLTGRLLRSMLARREAADVWIATIQEPMRREGTTAAYAAWLPELFVANDASLSRRSANLARIAMPVHLIWGEADTVTPFAQGENLARLVRARSFARLPGVGHIPHIEDEAGFLAALDRALGEAR